GCSTISFSLGFSGVDLCGDLSRPWQADRNRTINNKKQFRPELIHLLMFYYPGYPVLKFVPFNDPILPFKPVAMLYKIVFHCYISLLAVMFFFHVNNGFTQGTTLSKYGIAVLDKVVVYQQSIRNDSDIQPPYQVRLSHIY